MAARVKMPCARALYKFQGQTTHELDFSAGVSILLLRRVDENWLEGKLDGKVGIFPASHVKIEVGSPSMSHENALASSGKPYAVALHTFQGTQAGDLSFSKGDLIELLGDMATMSHGWIKGKLGSAVGIFPASFVAILRYPDKVAADTESVDLGTRENGVSTKTRPIPKPRPHAQKINSSVDQDLPKATPSSLTPSRSAPAPPNGPSPSSSQHTMKYGTLPKSACHSPPPSPLSTHQSFGTLPKPKPRTLTRNTASSTRVDILQSELAIEHKMLESAESLLVADPQSQAKSERRNKAITTHKSNIALLEATLADAKKSEETVAAAAKTPPPLPPPPPRPTLPVSSKEQQRAKIVDELVFTERDFHHQMELCSTKVLPALREVPDIQVDVLFGNMEEVTKLSGEFLSALEEACQDKQTPVGGVFTTFAPRMRGVYGAYCRSQDNASALYEKYMDTPAIADSIRHAMDMLRGEIQAWDLQSLLIKPMQRVLKYPLLLDKLVENTVDTHPDYKVVHSAREAIGKVAQDINEIKRRKDLVVKYTGKDDKRGSLTVHSLQKKMRRFQQTLTQFTGLRTKTIDPKFDELEQKVLSLESLIRNLLRDIANWQDQLQRVVESRVTLMEGMVQYSTNTQSLSQFQTYLTHLQQATRSQAKFVKDHVTVPLETLLGLFQNPLHLIQKRKDKLLDSDHMQYALDRAEDSEKIAQLREESLLAKRNYEALNTQLLEELPCFVDAVVDMLKHQLSVLVQAQYTFTSSIASFLQSLPALSHSSSPSTSTEIQQQHAEQLVTICKDLSKLSLVPASLGMNFSIRAGMTGASPLRKNSETNSPQDAPLSSSSSTTTTPTKEGVVEEGVAIPSIIEEQEGEEEESFEEVPLEGSKLQVLFDFKGQDSAELSVVAGQLVVLLCPHDRIGCKEWWLVQHHLVDTQDMGGAEACRQGYVPAAYLTEYDADR